MNLVILTGIYLVLSAYGKHVAPTPDAAGLPEALPGVSDQELGRLQVSAWLGRDFGFLVLDGEGNVLCRQGDAGDSSFPEETLACIPDYYADRPQGPGQGIMNLKDLSIEVMQVFARYYVLDEEYGHESTNFFYSLHYLNAQDEYIDVYNTEKPMDDLLGYPRYLRVEGSGQGSIDTNISPVPSNALATS